MEAIFRWAGFMILNMALCVVVSLIARQGLRMADMDPAGGFAAGGVVCGYLLRWFEVRSLPRPDGGRA
ncbi:hypothetical protein [Methylobacterium sp. CM6247]